MYITKTADLSFTLAVVAVCYVGLSKGANVLDQFLGKRYLLTSFDTDYKGVLEDIGVSSNAVNGYNGDKESYMLTMKDGLYCLTKSTPSGNTEVKIRFGKNIQMKTGDQRIVNAVFTQEGNSIKEVQTWNGGQNQATYQFTFQPNQLTVLSMLGGATGTQTYDLELRWSDKLLKMIKHR